MRYIYRDPLWADLIDNLHAISVSEQWRLVVQRDRYRARWHAAWQEENLDFLLTVPNAMPAIPAGGMKNCTVAMASYVFLFNVLDYTAGVLPVTFVDSIRDALPSNFKRAIYPTLSTVAKGSYDNYDAGKMHGLPVGVQVVGKRLEEEKVIAGMKAIEAALKRSGHQFIPKAF